MKYLSTFVFILIVFLSCSEQNLEGPQTKHFPLLNDGNLSLQYYFDYDESIQTPEKLDTLNLITKKNIEIYHNFYTAFYYRDSSDLYIHDRETNRIIYNFLPIRYEDGNYYEVIENINELDNYEVLVLKDSISAGDKWETVSVQRDDTLHFKLEVMEFMPKYTSRSYTFYDVYKLKQIITRVTESGYVVQNDVSFHYYNKKYGIIRKEIPPYQSGTYVTVIFDRLIFD